MFCDEFILADLRLFDNCVKVLKGCDHCFNLAADMGGMVGPGTHCSHIPGVPQKNWVPKLQSALDDWRATTASVPVAMIDVASCICEALRSGFHPVQPFRDLLQQHHDLLQHDGGRAVTDQSCLLTECLNTCTSSSARCHPTVCS